MLITMENFILFIYTTLQDWRHPHDSEYEHLSSHEIGRLTTADCIQGNVG